MKETKKGKPRELKYVLQRGYHDNNTIKVKMMTNQIGIETRFLY